MQEELEIDDLYGTNDQRAAEPLDPFNEPTNVPEEPKSTKEVIADFDNTVGRNVTPDPVSGDAGDLWDMIFAQRGINPNDIPIEDETGRVRHVRFDQLPKQDQLDMLFHEEPDEAYTFTPEEEDVINAWRESGMSPIDYINTKIDEGVDSINMTDRDNFSSLNNYDDDTLYAAKLKHDYPTLSDEQRDNMLLNAKSDADAYSKQIESIRNDIDRKETAYLERIDTQRLKNRRALKRNLYGQFVNKLNDPNFVRMDSYNYALDNNEKRNIVDFVYKKDRSGMSGFDKILANPANKAKLAYYALYGDNIINSLSNSYLADVNAAKRSGFADGFASAGGRNTVKYGGSQRNPYSNKKDSNGIVDIDDLNY